MSLEITDAIVVADMQRWLERAVIGLNLCPFAKAAHVKGQIHYAVSQAQIESELLNDLKREAGALMELDESVRDTTLLMTPFMLSSFLDYNDFLGRAEKLLRRMKLEGALQIASFHPLYQFADTDFNDVTNFTNRAPYPVLHLLREESVDKAVDAFPEADEIYGRNMATMKALGIQGWQALHLDATLMNTRNPK